MSEPFTEQTFYRCQVTDIESDETKTGRIRVRLLGYMDDIPSDNLPWADRACIYTPEIGDIVWCFLENNDPMMPVYVYKAFHQTGDGADDKVNHYRERDAGDIGDTIDSNAKSGIPTVTSTWDEPEDNWAAEYPHNKVFNFGTSSGQIVVEVDETTGEKRFHIYHPSGSRLEIDKDGKITLHAEDDLYIVTKGALRVNADGDLSLTTGSKLEIKTAAAVNINNNLTVDP